MNKVVLLVTVFASFICASAVEYNYKEIDEKVYKRLVENKEKKDQTVIAEVNKYLESVETKNDAQKLAVIKYKLWVYDQTKDVDNSFNGIKKHLEELLANAKLDNSVSDVKKLEMMSIWYKTKETDGKYTSSMYNAIKTTKNGTKFADSGFWAYFAKQYEDAYAFYMENKVFPDRSVNIAVMHLKNPNKALVAANMITEKTYPVGVVTKVVTLVLENVVTSKQVNQEEVKLFLQNVNKRYSRLMKEDENSWAPVIGDVRMTLEAY